MKTGSCLCGAVRFDVNGPLRPVIACHCSQCRKQSSAYAHFTAAQDRDFTMTSDRGLKWYNASEMARRGFCGECGSLLFWKSDDRTNISIAAAAFDNPTGFEFAGHIYCADKGDYYEISRQGYQLPQE